MSNRLFVPSIRAVGHGEVLWAKNLFRRRVGWAIVVLFNEGYVKYPLENVARMMDAEGWRPIGDAIRDVIKPGWQDLRPIRFHEPGRKATLSWTQVGDGFCAMQQKHIITTRLEQVAIVLENFSNPFPGIAHAVRERVRKHGEIYGD